MYLYWLDHFIAAYKSPEYEQLAFDMAIERLISVGYPRVSHCNKLVCTRFSQLERNDKALDVAIERLISVGYPHYVHASHN